MNFKLFKFYFLKIYVKLRIQKYGKTIKFQTANNVIVLTTDLQAIREILIEKNFPKNPNLYNSLGYPYNIRFIS